MLWSIFWALRPALAAMGISSSTAPRCTVDLTVLPEVTAQRHGVCHRVMETSTVPWCAVGGLCSGTDTGATIAARVKQIKKRDEGSHAWIKANNRRSR